MRRRCKFCPQVRNSFSRPVKKPQLHDLHAILAQSVADLTFTYAEREAVWLNRYNKDDKSLKWAFKEGFYQKRIRELPATERPAPVPLFR